MVPSSSNSPDLIEKETFTPVLLTTPAGKTVLDFKQNIAGYVSFQIYAHAGQKIRLRFGEMLDSHGEFTQDNIQCKNKHITTPLQQVEYICKEGENCYKPTFAIFGFQYVLVETEVSLSLTDVMAGSPAKRSSQPMKSLPVR